LVFCLSELLWPPKLLLLHVEADRQLVQLLSHASSICLRPSGAIYQALFTLLFTDSDKELVFVWLVSSSRDADHSSTSEIYTGVTVGTDRSEQSDFSARALTHVLPVPIPVLSAPPMFDDLPLI
jgi:hypothetical protein